MLLALVPTVALPSVMAQPTSSTSGLLNDLRAIQFPAGAAGAPAQPPMMPFGAANQGQAGLPGMASAAVGSLGGISFSGPGGAGSFGGGSMGLGANFGGPGTMPTAPAAGGMPTTLAGEPPEDMSCAATPRAAAWTVVKQHFQGIVAPSPPMQLASREAMSSGMEAVVSHLKSTGALTPETANECGLGKLCLQLLSFALVDDPGALVQLFTGFEELASPVLTLLLDVPWALLGASGFPFFGLLAQINLRRAHVPGALNNDAIDGLDDPAAKAYQAELLAALAAGGTASVDKASAAFMQRESQASALGPLTALAAQAAGGAPQQERLAFLQGLQLGFKQAIGNARELDIAMGTQWPLWSVLQLAVEHRLVA